MSLFAIASFVQNGEPVGARIFNTESNKVTDLKNRDIINYINIGKVIENIDKVDNNIHWKSGVYSRYPMIHADNTIENKDSATVVGVVSNSYKIVNYEGREAIVNLDKLHQYSVKFGITNCKLSNKSKIVVQPISGVLPKLASKFSMKLKDMNTLIIDLPEDNSIKELNIPVLINGIMSKTIDTIVVSSKSAALHIKKITFGENVSYINKSMIDSFPNLEILVMNSNAIFIEEYAFSNSRLKQFYAKGIFRISSDAFFNCRELEKIEVTHSTAHLGPRAFRNCVKIDVQDVLNLGFPDLYFNNIFQGCLKEVLEIPETVENVNLKSLNGIKGLKKLIIKGNRTIVRPNKDDFIVEEIVFNEGSSVIINRAEESNYGFNEKTKITIVKNDSNSKLSKSIAKSRLSGMSLEHNSLTVSKKEDIAVVMKTRTQSEIRDFIVMCINDALSSYNNWNGCYKKIGDYTIRYYISFGNYISNSTIVGEAGKGVFYGSSTYYTIFPTSKELIIDFLKSENYRHPSYVKDFIIPKYSIKNNGKITNIDYDQSAKELVITFRSKKEVRVSIDNNLLYSR